MSRCFPFPPPGYILNKNHDEAVIESIKGAEEKAKKEQRRKERKREKKEKREKEKKREGKDGESKEKREKKEKKRKEREGKDGESEKRHHKRRRSKEEGSKDGQNEKKVDPKLKENMIECLEKSSLTVERDLLQSTSQGSCDSTLKSNEKLPKVKEKQPLNGRHNNDSESAIRIRLPIRRQNDSKVMVINNDQQKPCPSRGINFEFSKPATEELPVNQHPCSTSAPEHASEPCNKKTRKDLKLASEPSNKKTRKDMKLASEPSNKKERKDKKLGKEGLSSLSAPETYQPTSLCNICPPSLAAQFLNVVENWVPKPIERRVELTNSEDEDCWWVSKKPSNHKFDTERCKQLINENNQTSSSVSWPCARLLPEADVYALPYTVPF